MIAIVDYGMGNLRSVEKAFLRVGCEAFIATRPEEVRAAQGVVLPGVGAFGDAMENLRQAGWVEPLLEAIAEGKPFLGICLGLQLLFEESEESPGVAGLGVFRGKVVRFRHRLKVPHIGWNQLHRRASLAVLEGIPEGAYAYFVHSYHVEPEDEGLVATTTDYGYEFVSGIGRGSLAAFQFHPEKSQATGLRLLRNFGRLAGSLREA